MQTYDIDVSGHKIQISYSLWSGNETVSYDGGPVSEQKSFKLATVHSFTVEEEGQPVRFDVTNAGQMGYVIRRNDVVVAERQRPFMAYLTGVATLLLSLGLMDAVLFLLVSAGVSSLEEAEGLVGFWAIPLALVGGLPAAWWLTSYARRPNPPQA